MHTLGELLGRIPLPELELGTQPGQARADVGWSGGIDLVHDLGAGLPAGHLHLWGGAEGVGKTAFFLSLLHGAAGAGRGVMYATYDLPAETLALRLLAMTAGVEVDALPDPGGRPEVPADGAGRPRPDGTGLEGAGRDGAEPRLDAAALARVHQARTDLAALPFVLLQARGLSVRSLEDRVARAPFRPAVLAVDYLQGIIRPSGTDLGSALRDLAAMATRCHVATLCAVRSRDGATSSGAEAVGALAGDIPDRVGWIATRPSGETARADGAVDQARLAELLRNRHGPCAKVRLDVAPGSGALSCASPGGDAELPSDLAEAEAGVARPKAKA